MDWTDYSDVTEKMEPAKEQLAVLDDLLSYIDSTGKDALFILSPYGMEKEARMKFNDLTERIEAAGYPVLDFNQHIDEIGLDFSTDFYDYGGHVNALGEGKQRAGLRKLGQRLGAVSAEAERGRGKLPEGYRRRKLGTGGRRLKERRLSRCAELQDFATVRKPGGRI